MTTAHRPTFVSRKGNNIYTDIPTLQFSVKDLPSNTILKLRFNEEEGRYINDDDFLKPKNPKEERQRMIKELRKREREEKRKKEKEEENEILTDIHKRKKLSENLYKKIKKQVKEEKEKKEEKVEKEEKEEKVEKKLEEEEEELDSEEELMKELEKIKKEQEEETKRKNEEIKERLEKEMLSLKEKNDNESNSHIMSYLDSNNNNYNNFTSNSLSRRPEEFSLKKKWYEDTIFRNQSRKEEKQKKRFINDTVHSDFNYRFLDKAVL